MEKSIVILEVAPKIKSNIEEASKSIDKLIASLNIDKLVATEDTKKNLKEVSSKLSKLEFEYEDSRKTLKKALLESYDAMLPFYDEHILDKIGDAKNKIKSKITFVEDAQRKEKKDALGKLFLEHCEFNDIDFVKFEDVGLKINISTTLKKLTEQLNEYFFNMSEEMASIQSMANADDIMVEYRLCKNFALAVKIVQDREEQKKIVEDKKAEIKISSHVKVAEIKEKKIEPEKVGFVKLYVKTTVTKWSALKAYMQENEIEFGKL